MYVWDGTTDEAVFIVLENEAQMNANTEKGNFHIYLKEGLFEADKTTRWQIILMFTLPYPSPSSTCLAFHRLQ